MIWYNWNRYYLPELGRYSQTESPEERISENTYPYVFNNPMIYFDFMGLRKCSASEYAACYAKYQIGYEIWWATRPPQFKIWGPTMQAIQFWGSGMNVPNGPITCETYAGALAEFLKSYVSCDCCNVGTANTPSAHNYVKISCETCQDKHSICFDPWWRRDILPLPGSPSILRSGISGLTRPPCK
jgi:hypothetical protein